MLHEVYTYTLNSYSVTNENPEVTNHSLGAQKKQQLIVCLKIVFLIDSAGYNEQADRPQTDYLWSTSTADETEKQSILGEQSNLGMGP